MLFSSTGEVSAQQACGGVTGICRSGGCLGGETPDNVNGWCTDATQDCCISAVATPAGGMNTIEFTNPITPTTIPGFLQALLNSLRGIIVVVSIIFILIGAIMYMVSAGSEKMITTAKSCITGALIGLAIAMAAPSFLQEILTMIGSNQTVPGAITLQAIALNVLRFLLSIGGVIAIISLIIGGITYTTAYGDEERLDKAKKIIAYSLLGIVIAMGALVLVRQVMSFFGT